MTAEEIFQKHWELKTDHPIDDVIKLNIQYCKNAMIEFAKHHVELAIYEFSCEKHDIDKEERIKTQMNIEDYLENIK